MKKLIIFFLALTILVPVSASAQTYDSEVGLVPKECFGTAENCNLCSVLTLVTNISDMVIGFSGAIAILMFTAGGILLVANYGNESWIKMGKEIIIAAVIGIFIIFLSWTLINLIIFSIYGGDTGAFATFTGKSTWSGPCNK